jgi:hypothetical protein
MFTLQIFDGDAPRDSQPYELTVCGDDFEQRLAGTTDSDGVLTAEVPEGASMGTIVIGHDRHTFDLTF